MSMDEAVPLSVPAAVRRIFAAWSEQGDPAAWHPGDDPAVLAGFYRSVATAAAEMHLARHAVARIHEDAAHNREFGQFAELRREGEQVLPWIAGLVAADPELAASLRQTGPGKVCHGAPADTGRATQLSPANAALQFQDASSNDFLC